MNDCPCGSGLLIDDCCAPIIVANSATTALALMRSRYTAYCICNVDYLRLTLHSSKRTLFDAVETEAWSRANRWTQLEIISTECGQAKDIDGIVCFKAHFMDADAKLQIHHECSRFVKEEGTWFYVDGDFFSEQPVLPAKVQRNSLCPCGSGRKYKSCCM